MKKRVVDLTFEELSQLAAAAGAAAIKETLAAGRPVTGTADDYPGISRLYPDGRIEPLPPEQCFEAEMDAFLHGARPVKREAAE